VDLAPILNRLDSRTLCFGQNRVMWPLHKLFMACLQLTARRQRLTLLCPMPSHKLPLPRSIFLAQYSCREGQCGAIADVMALAAVEQQVRQMYLQDRHCRGQTCPRRRHAAKALLLRPSAWQQGLRLLGSPWWHIIFGICRTITGRSAQCHTVITSLVLLHTNDPTRDFLSNQTQQTAFLLFSNWWVVTSSTRRQACTRNSAPSATTVNTCCTHLASRTSGAVGPQTPR
jgi:hypothetical protein